MNYIAKLSEFCDFIKNFEGNIILVMHKQADPDAVGSAIALTNFFNYLNSNLRICTFEPNISQLGLQLQKLTGFEFDVIQSHQIDASALIILLDTNSFEPLFISPTNPLAIFDHHIKNKSNIEVQFDFHLETFHATSEIITTIYRQMNILPNLMVSQALLAGLIFDTRRFLYATKNLFECVIYLTQDNPNIYLQVMTLFTSSPSFSEKIACIKAAQRMKRYMINNKVLLISHVSSFEAAAARSLIFLGADISIVIAAQKHETRISFRTDINFPIETGISLGKDIVPALIAKFGGEGGGHNGAAGYNCPTKLDVTNLRNFIVKILREAL